MIILKKEISGATLNTEFEFDDDHIKLVKDVLKCLEGKTTDVLNGEDENTLTPISILDWFPIVCSSIHFDNSGSSYITFFNPTIMALTLRIALQTKEEPPVDVFTGKIKLSKDLKNNNDAFCFALIHEMQHAINAMKYAYPALTNWEGFLFNIIKIEELYTTEGFNSTIDRLTVLDRLQYGVSIEEELKILENTFGPAINTWREGYIKCINNIKVT
jgi:hypothetical protein